MMKKVYQTPQSELFEIKLDGVMLAASVETMHTVIGSWEEDDEE